MTRITAPGTFDERRSNPEPCWLCGKRITGICRAACDRCGGAGGYHDCGEDTCPCADPGGPDDPDWITCEDCGGSGHAN